MVCPLCNCEESCPSWIGTIVHLGREFPYVECASCRSLYCDPMPDDEFVARMYGSQYAQSAPEGGFITDNPKEPERVVAWLGREKPGTFVDYGCGDGALLDQAARLGWRAVGVEIDPAVARRTSERTGHRVVTHANELLGEGFADVVHLGDVIEHLTKINEQLPDVLGLVKPGGLLLAQGPLEANANLFTLVLRLSRFLRRARRTEMAPHHVLLATRDGQRILFERFGLREVEYIVREVAWPAPNRLSAANLRSPRAVGLYGLRQCSQLVTALRPGVWGNRYFYVGRKLV